MAENFQDMKKVKAQRGSFMNAVKEVKRVPKPEKKEKIKTDEPVAEVKPEEAEDQGKVSLQKGFVVGFTDEGLVKLQSFGGINDLELVGLVEYSKTKSTELLSQAARTNVSHIPALKDGVTVLAHGIKALLGQNEAAAAS